jgi:hypothetical protein
MAFPSRKSPFVSLGNSWWFLPPQPSVNRWDVLLTLTPNLVAYCKLSPWTSPPMILDICPTWLQCPTRSAHLLILKRFGSCKQLWMKKFTQNGTPWFICQLVTTVASLKWLWRLSWGYSRPSHGGKLIHTQLSHREYTLSLLKGSQILKRMRLWGCALDSYYWEGKASCRWDVP